MTQRSKSANFAALLGVASLVLMVLGSGLAFLRVLAPVAGFGLFALGMLAGIAAFGLGFLGLTRTTRGSGRSGRGKAVYGLVLGSLALLFISTAIVTRGFRTTPGECNDAGTCGAAVLDSIYQVAYRPADFLEEQSHEFSPINDISTDLDDPPEFFGALVLGGDWSFPEASRERQPVAYPDVETIYVGGEPEDNFQIVVDVAKRMGWTITIQRPDIFAFEATDETGVFRFVDDIAVRMRPSPRCPVPADSRCKSTAIDTRSKSRDGRSDFGKNAARILAFNEMVRAYTVEDAPVVEEVDIDAR